VIAAETAAAGAAIEVFSIMWETARKLSVEPAAR
jgi:hypothetical protein